MYKTCASRTHAHPLPKGSENKGGGQAKVPWTRLGVGAPSLNHTPKGDARAQRPTHTFAAPLHSNHRVIVLDTLQCKIKQDMRYNIH